MYIPSYSVIVTGCSFFSLSIISILPILLALAYSIAASSVGQVLNSALMPFEISFVQWLIPSIRSSSAANTRTSA